MVYYQCCVLIGWYTTRLYFIVLNCPYLLLNEQSLSYGRSCDLACFPYQGSWSQSELSLQYWHIYECCFRSWCHDRYVGRQEQKRFPNLETKPFLMHGRLTTLQTNSSSIKGCWINSHKPNFNPTSQLNRSLKLVQGLFLSILFVHLSVINFLLIKVQRCQKTKANKCSYCFLGRRRARLRG